MFESWGWGLVGGGRGLGNACGPATPTVGVGQGGDDGFIIWHLQRGVMGAQRERFLLTTCWSKSTTGGGGGGGGGDDFIIRHQWYRDGLVFEAHSFTQIKAQGTSRTCNESKEEEEEEALVKGGEGVRPGQSRAVVAVEFNSV